MEIRETILKNLLRLLLLPAIFIFAGCMPFSKPELLIDTYQPTEVRTDWEKYGAYYEIDELFVEASYQSAYLPLVGSYSSPMSRILISKRIRILTKEGTDYATVPVPSYGGNLIKVFNLKLFDPEGNKKPLNITSLKAEYQKDGLIIFPNVTPGCVLDIYIEFSSSKPIISFERWFSRIIPVQEAKFTFSRIEKFEYEFKEYGKLPVGQSRTAPTNPDLTYTVWSRKNILPRSKVDYQGTYDKTEPRVAVAMRYGFDKAIYEGWDDITSKFRDELIHERYTILENDIKVIVDTLSEGISSKYEKADRILAWVQDNISFRDDDYSDFEPDDVIKDGKGTSWEMSVACKEMFDVLGLETDIVLTRSHSRGGFDETFVTPYSTSVPLVTVTIDKVNYCAYPYRRGGKLGEYPQDYFNLKGVSLKTQRVIQLPPSVSEKSYSEYSYVIDLTDESLLHKLDMVFEGYLAYRLRSLFLSAQNKDLKEGFQKILTSYDKSNALEDCEVFNLNARGKPLKAKLTFVNSNQVIERKGVKRVSLKHLFDDYFSSLDTNRISPFTYKNDLSVHESIIIKKPEGKEVKVTMCSEPINNKLFSVTWSNIDNPKFYKFIRDIKINKCDIAANEINEYYREIVKLNQIKDSYLLIE